ncbi:hypothetical protein Tco_1053312 [Tanacetum coccineum]
MVKSWLVQDQTVLGKDYSNLLIADSLLKTIWFINAPCYGNEALASPKANELTIPEQMATGKGTSNPFIAGSFDNYDNDNENDDLGYHSEEYFDEAQEDDENNHSNGNVFKRGITRLYKFRREYGKPDGIKLSVTFDALNRISGKHRRYFDVDLTVKKLVMNRLGQLLRNFKRKLRQIYILPNKNTLLKLNEVPAKYSAILQVEEWVSFVKYTTTEEYKVKSAASKMARSKSVYQHTMGRGGYAVVKAKMIETEDKINEGTLKVDHGTDEMTVVLGKEKGGYARGVRSGVTYKRYFDLSRSRYSSDERILLLQSQLDNERRERQEKELLIQNLSNKMSQTEGMVSSVDINLINSNADEEGGTTVVGCENDASIQKSNKTPPG